MNSGILLVNKPKMMTSNKVIQIIKRQLKLHKVGHAGTLDPLATGVLIVLVNQGTKISSLLLNEDKEYVVTMLFNTLTDSGDVTGNVIATDDVVVSKEVFTNNLKEFKLSYLQYPPSYSAIKVNGKKLYEYARSNQDVPKVARKVNIEYIKVISFNFPEVVLQVKCSKGTYIRSLVEDIATSLGTLATVKQLERIASGTFQIDACKSIELISTDDLISITDVLKGYMPAVLATDEIAVKNGKPLVFENVTANNILVIDQLQAPLAIYSLQQDNKYYCQKGLWYDNEAN